MIKHCDGKDFDTEIKDKVVLVDFFATWCGPCRMLGSELEEIADQIDILKVDIDDNMDLAKKYGIMVVPTMLILQSGELKQKLTGFMKKEEILLAMKPYLQ